jgi:hypothetical protein
VTECADVVRPWWARIVLMDEVPEWRRGVDLQRIDAALRELEPLLRAVARTGSVFLIKVDGLRSEGAHPSIFTVVASGDDDGVGVVRVDDADLVRAVAKAIAELDSRLQA